MSDAPQQPQAQDTASYQKQMIRRRFLESVAAILLVLAIIGLPLSLARIFRTSLHPNHVAHIVAAVLVVWGFFARKRLSDRLLTLYVISIFSFLSVAAFLQYGLVSAGFYFAAAAIFVTAVALGLRGGMVCTGLYALFILAMAYLWISGRLVFPDDVDQYILLPSVWATLGVTFLITTAILFVSATGFFRGLTELVDTIDRQRQEIEQRSAELTRTNRELEAALGEIKTLSGLLPICARCKKIRDDKGYWQQVEHYVQHRSQATFTHSLCPDCLSDLYPEIADRVLRRLEEIEPE